ncbi:Uncharacterized alpha/beta hydrolase domain [Collimonas sp. OK412]|jgi:hypothetical protein|nr:Uncharacterized alpha/beta hydrolase domain [Collimonas sp. OK412]
MTVTDEITFAVASIRQAPTAAIAQVLPKHYLCTSNCEEDIDLGLFFDGTRNNMYEDKPSLKHSNIARLHDAYLEDPPLGARRVYINGVGTPFPEIGELSYSNMGNGFGSGCEARVLYGLLAVFNTIHARAYDDQPFFRKEQVKALCRNSFHVSDPSDLQELKKLGITEGLLMSHGGLSPREEFLKRQANFLEKKLSTHGKPDIKECFIDVFGFSRGAAEARVFCQWLDKLLVGGKLAGVIIRFRFVGLIDTVASAGVLGGLAGTIVNSTGGHDGWATAKDLRIPTSVENCVHMVAMHELRKNFPIDELGVDGVLPPHCQEFVYPGAHSDVGGGYEPGELGISVGNTLFESDALKLSQIPLNHMFDCAVAAGAPLDKERATSDSGHAPFVVSPRVEQAFNDFLTASTMKPRPIHEWLQPYLNWRWQVCKRYEQLAQVQKANAEDRKLLIDSNKILMKDADLIGLKGDVSLSQRFLDFIKGQPGASLKAAEYRQAALSALDPEAPALLDMAKNAPPTTAAIAALFDGFVHDSYAGFTPAGLHEATGYWRYRKGFRGGSEATIASNDANNQNAALG